MRFIPRKISSLSLIRFTKSELKVKEYIALVNFLIDNDTSPSQSAGSVTSRSLSETVAQREPNSVYQSCYADAA